MVLLGVFTWVVVSSAKPERQFYVSLAGCSFPSKHSDYQDGDVALTFDGTTEQQFMKHWDRDCR